MHKLAHSYSAIKMYENCPKRYYHQRVLKTVQDRQDQSTEARDFGTQVHKALEEWLTSPHGLDFPYPLKHAEAFCSVLKEKHGEGVETWCEQSFALDANLEPTTWFDKSAWFRAILDVVIVNKAQKKAIVIDWKTGKHRPDHTQMQMFALQLWKHRPEIEDVMTMLVWVKENPLVVDSIIYKKVQAPELWKSFFARTKRIENSLESNAWPALPSGLCPYCPLFETCEEAQDRT